jgi:hypothetical protein
MPVSDAIFFSAEATPHFASTCQSPLAGRETLCPACRFVTSLLVDSHAVAMLPLAVQVAACSKPHFSVARSSTTISRPGKHGSSSIVDALLGRLEEERLLAAG